MMHYGPRTLGILGHVHIRPLTTQVKLVLLVVNSVKLHLGHPLPFLCLALSDRPRFLRFQKKSYAEGNDTLFQTIFYFNLKHKKFFALQF